MSVARPIPRHSLRAQGVAATLALLAFVLGSLTFVTVERGRLDADLVALQQVSAHDKALSLAEEAVASAIIDVGEVADSGQADAAHAAEVGHYMATCARLFADLAPFDATYRGLADGLAVRYDHLQAEPAPPQWLGLREALGQAVQALERRRRGLAAERDALTAGYQTGHDAVTRHSLLLALTGVLGFGVLAAVFVGRLTRDIRRLEHHARQIVDGERGVALPVARGDELGQLAEAVNRLSADLDAREQALALAQQRRAHHDKMQALGALAAGMAHEVNNPLTVIASLAQTLGDEARPTGAGAAGPTGAAVAEAAAQILAQTRRAAHAAHHLAELAAPPAEASEWLDLNALLGRLLELMGYDRRYRAVAVERDLDPAIDALWLPPAALQLVLMQLLTLAADALAARPRGAPPAALRVATRAVPDAAGGRAVRLTVQAEAPAVPDDGDGLPPDASTRPLDLVRRLLGAMRGELEVHQDEGLVLCITLHSTANPDGD